MKTLSEISKMLDEIRSYPDLNKVPNSFGITGMQLNFLKAVIAVERTKRK